MLRLIYLLVVLWNFTHRSGNRQALGPCIGNRASLWPGNFHRTVKEANFQWHRSHVTDPLQRPKKDKVQRIVQPRAALNWLVYALSLYTRCILCSYETGGRWALQTSTPQHLRFSEAWSAGCQARVALLINVGW